MTIALRNTPQGAMATLLAPFPRKPDPQMMDCLLGQDTYDLEET